MPRPQALAALFCATLLIGCGGEIARIEGLPQTRDVSAVPWPRLVDTPAPSPGLRPEAGVAVQATLDRSRAAVRDRVARPGPPRVAREDLGGRVARIRQQASADTGAVDGADLSARATRLAQVRAIPTGGLSAEELAARVRRIDAARSIAPGGVDAGGLRERARRIASARTSVAGGLGEGELQARARRVETARTAPAARIDGDTLALRGARGRAQAGTVFAGRDDPLERRRRIDAATRLAAPPAPAPAPRPASPPRDRATPVISDAFRKRAEEARARALERAQAGGARAGETE